MKAALLFLMIAGAVLLCPTGRATTTDDAKPRQKATPPAPQVAHRTTTDKRAHESVTLPKPASPRRASSIPKGSVDGKTVNGRQRVSEQRNSRTSARLGASRDTIRARRVRPATVSPPEVAAPNNTRHHGANPTTIGGSRSTTVASTAALNGRAVSRRP